MTKQSQSLNQGKAAGASKLKLSSAFLAMALSFYCVAAQAGERAEALALLARLLKEEQERQAQLEQDEQETVKAENDTQADIEANVDSSAESMAGVDIDADFIAELIRELDAETDYFFESEYSSLSGGQVYFVADAADAAGGAANTAAKKAEKSFTKKLTNQAKEEAKAAASDALSDATSSVKDAATDAVSESATAVQESVVERVQIFLSDNSTVIIGGVAAVGTGLVVANQFDEVEGGNVYAISAHLADLNALVKDNMFVLSGTYELSANAKVKITDIMTYDNGASMFSEWLIETYRAGKFDVSRTVKTEDNSWEDTSYDAILNAAAMYSALHWVFNQAATQPQQEVILSVFSESFYGTIPSFQGDNYFTLQGLEIMNYLAREPDSFQQYLQTDVTTLGVNVFELLSLDDNILFLQRDMSYSNVGWGMDNVITEMMKVMFVWDEFDYEVFSLKSLNYASFLEENFPDHYAQLKDSNGDSLSEENDYLYYDGQFYDSEKLEEQDNLYDVLIEWLEIEGAREDIGEQYLGYEIVLLKIQNGILVEALNHLTEAFDDELMNTANYYSKLSAMVEGIQLFDTLAALDVLSVLDDLPLEAVSLSNLYDSYIEYSDKPSALVTAISDSAWDLARVEELMVACWYWFEDGIFDEYHDDVDYFNALYGVVQSLSFVKDSIDWNVYEGEDIINLDFSVGVHLYSYGLDSMLEALVANSEADEEEVEDEAEYDENTGQSRLTKKMEEVDEEDENVDDEEYVEEEEVDDADEQAALLESVLEKSQVSYDVFVLPLAYAYENEPEERAPSVNSIIEETWDNWFEARFYQFAPESVIEAEFETYYHYRGDNYAYDSTQSIDDLIEFDRYFSDEQKQGLHCLVADVYCEDI